MKEIKVRFKNGLVKVFDNWLAEHVKGAMGWFTD